MSTVVQERQTPSEIIYQGEKVNNSCWVTCSTPLAVCPLVIGTTPFSVYFAWSLLLLCYRRETWVGPDTAWNKSWTVIQTSYLIPPLLFVEFSAECLSPKRRDVVLNVMTHFQVSVSLFKHFVSYPAVPFCFCLYFGGFVLVPFSHLHICEPQYSCSSTWW